MSLVNKVISKIKNIRLKLKYRWKEPFKKVSIPSSIDGKIQQAYFYTPDSNKKTPLLVSLHSWAGDYTQIDPTLSKFAVNSGWHYIHPDFRGKNTHPEACGSPLSMSDIDDAISFSINNGNVDTENIFIVGGSGGAYAALCYYAVANHPINSYIAWSPITDLIAWHDQSVIRKSRYSKDLIAGTNSTGSLDVEEAEKRSPLYLKNPSTDSKLFLFSGYHDGYGDFPVPVSHSLNYFNKYTSDNNGSQTDYVSKDEIIRLLSKEQLDISLEIGGKEVYYTKSFKNAQVTIFDGGHSHLEEHTIKLLNDNKIEFKNFDA